MKPLYRNQRLTFLVIAGLLLALAAFLVLRALERNISFFYTPSKLYSELVPENRDIRIGGLVETGSVILLDDARTKFSVTDGAYSVDVVFAGVLPDLFREGQGVIAQGRFDGPVRIAAEKAAAPLPNFTAVTILAKHDENYIPKELKPVLDKIEHTE